MIVAQFRAADADGAYSIDIKVVSRDRATTPA